LLLADTGNGKLFQKIKLSLTRSVYCSADSSQITVKEKMEKGAPVS